MDKKLAQRIHAKRRAAERYGLTINRQTQRDWIQLISDEKAVMVNKPSNRVRIYLIEHEGKTIKVVFDRIRRTIVTCLPLDPKLETL